MRKAVFLIVGVELILDLFELLTYRLLAWLISRLLVHLDCSKVVYVLKVSSVNFGSN